MKDFQVGDRVKVVEIVNDPDELAKFLGKEGVVSYIYPSRGAPFPVYVDFEGDEAGVPFALNEVEVVQ